MTNNQNWFRTPEWQAGEREADKALKNGKYKDFDNINDLIKYLNSISKESKND